MHRLSVNSKIQIPLMVACSILFSFYLWGNNLDAKFGLQDDHEIIDTLGPDSNLKISEFWEEFLQIGANVGTSLRFRPSYSVLRLSETFFWGDSPFKWHLFRIFLFSLFIFLLWLISDKYVGLLAGALFAMYVVSFEFWGGVMARLGPQENYAAVGAALYILGYANTVELIRKEDRTAGSSLTNWTLIAAGAFIAMGSKENFLILLVPTIILLVILSMKKLHRRLSVLTLSLILGYGAACGAVLIVALRKAGTDMYGSSIAPAARLNLAVDGFKKVFSDAYVLAVTGAVTLLVVIIYLFLLKRNDPEKLKMLRRKAVKYAGIAFLIFLGYLSQYIFYNGDFPSRVNDRYNVPGALAGPYLMLLVVLLLLELSNIFGKPTAWRRGIVAAFSVLLIVLISMNGFFQPLRKASRLNAETTQKGAALISQISLVMQREPQAGLIFYSQNSMLDEEHITAVAAYLRSHKVGNNFFVMVNLNSYQNVNFNANTGLGKLTTSRLLDLSSKGSRDFKRFSPMGLFDGKESCYYINFSAEAELPWCRNLASIGTPAGQ